MLAYITGTVDQELLLRNEYLAAENRILKAQIKGRLLLSEADKATCSRPYLRERGGETPPRHSPHTIMPRILPERCQSSLVPSH
jgi:hypothetical protein